MKVTSSFSYSKIAFDKINPVHLLITTEAPKLEAAQRVPLNLLVAIDVSPSMLGSKLDYAKKSARKLVEHLSSDDTLGIILFDHSVRVLFSPMKMTAENKEKARNDLSSVQITGYGTNIWSALHEGFNLAAKIDGSQVRFIFLTDGMPTTGETNPKTLLQFAKSRCTPNVAVTGFGYGSDHDSSFLTDLSTENRGNYSYIKNPDDALTAFGRELGGLLSCYAQNLKYTVTPKDGVKLLKVMSDVDAQEVGQGVEIDVPDLYSEGVRHLVLKVEVPKQMKTMPRAVTLVDVNLSYVETQSGETKTVSTKAKVSFVKAKDADTDPNKVVMEQVALCDLFEAQREAMKKAKAGDFAGAQTIIRSVQTDHLNPHGIQYQDLMMNSMSNAQAFASNSYTLNATLSSARTGRTSAGAAASFGCVNSVQDAMMDCFVQDDEPVATTTTTVGQVADTDLSQFITFNGGQITTLTTSPQPASKPENTENSLSRKRSKEW